MNVTTLSVRIPTELHRQLIAAARAEHRSINSQIVHLIAQALAPAPQERQ